MCLYSGQNTKIHSAVKYHNATGLAARISLIRSFYPSSKACVTDNVRLLSHTMLG